MKAAVLFASPGRLSIEDVEIAEVGRHEVLIDVRASGLCHSDLHLMTRAQPLAGPTVLGHEGAGVVAAVGADVTYVQPGDHVVGFLAGFCGQCEWCLSGRPTLCFREGLTRSASEEPRLRLRDGREAVQYAGLATFAEQMLVHENNVVRIDSDIPMEVAALMGCGVPTGIGAVIRTARVPAGSTVAVVGCGGVGLNAIQGAVLAGASRVIAIDVNEGKLATARAFGATDTVSDAQGGARQQVFDLLPGRGGVDFSFEAVGVKSTVELAFALLRRGGTATVIGVGHGTFELPMQELLWDRAVRGSTMGAGNFRVDLPALLELYKTGRIRLDPLVSRRIPLERVNDGYATIQNGDVARTVVVFD